MKQDNNTLTTKFKKFWVLEVNNYICDADYNGKALKERNYTPSFRKFWFIKKPDDLIGFTKRENITNKELVIKLLNDNPFLSEQPISNVEYLRGKMDMFFDKTSGKELATMLNTPEQSSNREEVLSGAKWYLIPNSVYLLRGFTDMVIAEMDINVTNELESENTRLKERIEVLENALRGVIKVADRKTDEFDKAKAALNNK